MAEREPDLTYHDPLVVTIGNIPFSEWRVRPFGWLAAVPLLFELPPPIEKERAELTPYSWTVSGGREASAAGQTRCSLIRSVLQRGVELKTVTPEKADKIRQGLYESFDDCNLNLDCYEKAQPIAVCLAESILQRGLKVKTVTPENADRIRTISDGYDRYLATQPIDRATGQKTRYLAESVLQRGLELKTITSEDADRIRAISDSYDRYFATQSIADCLAESVLQRGLELKTVTPEDADRIRAISDGYDRYLATQPIAVANERKTDDCEGGPQLNSRLKCTLKKPEPSSTQSPVLQAFFAEIRERRL